MRRPSFLVIGAMKSGTTTLYQDLRGHPELYVPEKETSILTEAVGRHDAKAEASRRYDTLFEGHSPQQFCGEVATTYSMCPHFPDVSALAAAVCAPDLRVVYILREPVSRIISHHHHDLAQGGEKVPIDDAVRLDPRLIDYTRYAAQARSWIDLLGRDRILFVRFEDYIAERGSQRDRVIRFLGLDPAELGDAETVHNSSETRVVALGWRKRLISHPAYRRLLRPLVPEAVRRRLTQTLLPAGPPRPTPPTAATMAAIRNSLAADQAALHQLAGFSWTVQGAPRS